MKTIKGFLRPVKVYYLYLKRRQSVINMRNNIKDRNFSIICNNCFAGRIYQDLGMPYLSPTAGLFFYADDYIEFLKDLPRNLTAEISFVETSRHALANERNKKLRRSYPIGVINNNIEIHFLHYSSEAEAKEKWIRRAKRVNFDRLYIINSEQNSTTEKEVYAFEKLPYKHKVFFTAHNYHSPSSIYINKFEQKGVVGDPYNYSYLFYRMFDFIKWFNDL